jgi:hypothetical protein
LSNSLNHHIFRFIFSGGCLAASFFIYIFFCLAGLPRCAALYFYFLLPRRAVSLRRSLFFYFLLSRRAVSFVYFISFFIFLVASNGWLAAVPPCVGFAGWLFGGMDSKPLLN